MLLLVLTLTAVPPPAQGQVVPPALGFTRDFSQQTPSGPVFALANHDDGSGRQLYVGGDFYDVVGQTQFMSGLIVRWNGSVWSRVSWGFDAGIYGPSGGLWDTGVKSLLEFDDGSGPKLYAGGNFDHYWSVSAGAVLPCTGFARWNGTEWDLPGASSMAFVHSMVVFDDGSGPAMYAGGYYGGGVKRFDGVTWSTVGGPLVPTDVYEIKIKCLFVHDDGTGSKLFVAGNFDLAEGQPAAGMAYWDGSHWTGMPPMPMGFDGPHVQGMASFSDSGGPALYVSNGGHLLRWRGGAWSIVSELQWAPMIRAMTVLDDGNGPALFVSGGGIRILGMPTNQFANFARYDGIGWSPIGALQPTYTDGAYATALFDFSQGSDLYFGGNYGPSAAGQSSPYMARYRLVHRSIAAVCGGDGSLTLCPCDTRGNVGHGCPNSVQASGALLQAGGSTSDDSITLHSTLLPSNTMGLLYQGSAYDYLPSFLGDGVRCTGGNTARLFAKSAVNGGISVPDTGDPTLRARANALGDPLPPGSVRYYQLWYRDPDPGFCAAGGIVNTTNGMRIEW